MKTLQLSSSTAETFRDLVRRLFNVYHNRSISDYARQDAHLLVKEAKTLRNSK